MTVVTLRIKSRVESPVNCGWWVVLATFLMLPTRLPAVDEPGIPERAENWSFPAALYNAFTATHKLRPCSPFSDGKNAGNRTYPGWMAWISALCTCTHTMHAVKKSLRAVSGGFSVVCCLFCRFPVRNALRISGGADNGCYGKCENISLDKSFQENKYS